MVLDVCAGCRCHVRADAASCPFCRAPRAPTALPTHGFARTSRAIVFAGATLAGCYTAAPAPQTTPPPNTFAQPPSGPAVPSTGSIVGSLYDEASGNRLPSVTIDVTAIRDGAVDPASVRRITTGPDGTFTVADLPPGEYLLTIYAGVQRMAGQGWPTYRLNILSGAPPTRWDVPIKTTNPHPIAAPYGAPPSRRRTV